MQISEFTRYAIRFLGLCLIILGSTILITGAFAGLGYWIFQQFLAGNLVQAVLISGTSFLVTGFILRLIFPDRHRR